MMGALSDSWYLLRVLVHQIACLTIHNNNNNSECCMYIETKN